MAELSRGRTLSLALTALAAASVLLMAPPAVAQDAVEVITSANQPVPERARTGRPYKSWSLFLVCNPAWVLPESDGRLLALYENFRAFGMVIGPDHAAVWFRVSRDNDKRSLVDVLRSSAFCERLRLPPSQSPYIVVTTDYPGAGLLDTYPASFPAEPSAFAVIGLAGRDASDITRLLTSLADQLVLNKIRTRDVQKEEWWRSWERSYETWRASIVDTAKGLTFKIKTPFFEVEAKP